jgi:hypothetical protein
MEEGELLMKKVFAFVFVIMAGWAGYASACEFCTLHNGLGQYNNNGDFFSVTERYTTASTEVNNGKVVGGAPDTGGYAIQINTVQLMYQHSFTEDFKGVFSMPFFDKRSSNISNGSDTSSGIGDATAMARYRIWEGHHDQNLWLMVGLKLPTGGEKSTAVTGPAGSGFFNPDLVVGTGSLDELFGFVYSENIGSWSYALDALYKYSNTGYDGYRFGSVLNLGLSGYYKVHNNFNVGLGLVSEIMATDTDTAGNATGATGTVMNTGGDVVFLSPTFQYVNQNNYIDVSYQYPVYRNFIGVQTVVDNKLIIAYRHAF